MTARDTMASQDTARIATSLSRALDVLGDVWTMLILKEAFNGTRNFSDFQKRLGIPKQTLSDRLTHLCETELFYRRRKSAKHASLEYVMTPKAHDLYNVMYSVWLWHEAHRGKVDVLPFDVIHRTCGKVLRATYRCRACGDPATADSIEFILADPPQTTAGQRIARRKEAAVTAGRVSKDRGALAAAIVGDTPSIEILFNLFKGPHHLQGLVNVTGITLNVLRDRLDRLSEMKLISGSTVGRRTDYVALESAHDFLPLLLAMAEWGDRWCNRANPAPEDRVHACGDLLRGDFVCDHCHTVVRPGDVAVAPRAGAMPGTADP